MSLESLEFLELLSVLKESAPDIAKLSSEKQKETIYRWYGEWVGAKTRALASPDKLLEFGVLLAQSAETSSLFDVSDKIFTSITEDAALVESGIENPVAVLVTAGEYRRRVMNLTAAEATFLQAEKLCWSRVESGSALKSTFKDLGRLYYELAYLGRLRGDAATAIAWLERSAAVCDLAEDWVGAEVALTLKDVVLCEEGETNLAAEGLEKHLARFHTLKDDPQVIAAKRNGFANRWVLNTEYHLAQAYLARENPEGAEFIFDKLYQRAPSSPSTATDGTFLRLEALVQLQRGDLVKCNATLKNSREAIDKHSSVEIDRTEMGSVFYTLNGVLEALRGDVASARDQFSRACACNPEHHNHRMQGLAAAGNAILARDAGEYPTMREALAFGLMRVHRCGAPIRAFLLEIQKRSQPGSGDPTVNDLARIAARYC